MECEICGKEIRGRTFRIVVEGTELRVCASCKEYGVEDISSSSQHGTVRVVRKERSRPSRPIVFTEELVENYNEIIKRERQKRGWSQEELARKIQEKESLIRKIENAEITPEPEVVEKLERLFDVKLREKVQEVKIESQRKLVPTLGDVVVIKKKKKQG
ncbi:multiprotein bridging factor aMBF1 [Geoglobus acetivorans]|uniref:Putative HTH-type transcriptional regulator n=1 Tax=Geoglobus acetivorans TaxID=565033 RepID=A0A0A7GBR9_GEOAI|nr:putative HTH-type transcriptional regulator [Geoglobus acetivorans]